MADSARNPGLAALMSFFLMGLGQIYAGHIDRGIFLLVIHLSGALGTYSIYSKGVLYDLLLGTFSPGFLIILFYAGTVGMILLWIFNIKDAYYLSLFSSFRDWFEIERNVIPLISNYKVNLLPHLPEVGRADEDTDEAIEVERISDIPDPLREDEEEIIIPARRKKTARRNRPGRGKTSPTAAPGAGPEIEVSLFRPETSFNLKFYGGMGALLLLGSTLFFKQFLTKKDDPETHRPLSLQRELTFARAATASGTAGTRVSDTKKPADTMISTSRENPFPAYSHNSAVGSSPASSATAFLEAPSESSSPETFSGSSGASAFSGSAGSADPSDSAVLPAGSFENPSESISGNRPDATPELPRVTDAADSGEPGRFGNDAILHGMALIKNGELENGARHLEEGLKSVEAKPDVWRTLLSAYKQLEQLQAYEEALNRYLQAYQIDAEGWIALGNVHFERREYVEASRAFSRALQITPNHPRANFFLGTLYRELGIPEDAVSCLEKALSTDPLNPEFLRELGAAYLDSKQFRAAKRFLERALNVSPQDDAARGLLTQVEALAAEETSPSLVSAPTERVKSVTIPPAFVVPDQTDAATAGRNGTSLDGKPRRGPTVLYSAPEEELVQMRRRPTSRSESPETADNLLQPQPVRIISSANQAPVPTFLSTIAAEPAPSPAPPGSVPEPVKTAAGTAATSAAAQPSAPPTPTPAPVTILPGPSPSEQDVSRAIANKEPIDALAFAIAVDEPQASSGTASETTAAILPAPRPAVASSPLSLQDTFESGRQKYLAGRWNEALPHFLSYLKEREDPLVYEFTGDTFEKLGMNDSALDASIRAHELGRRGPKMAAKIGMLAEKAKRPQQAVPFLREAIQALPHRIDLSFSLVSCLRTMGETTEAETILNQLAERASGTYAIRQRIEAEKKALGKAGADSGNRDQAP
jgi:tetratricopeptide (TPR) repeat protein